MEDDLKKIKNGRRPQKNEDDLIYFLFFFKWKQP